MVGNEETIEVILPTWVRVLMPNGQVEEIKLETYLAGAVAAEIGSDAPLEALKAQAVASRTYVAATQRHREYNADVCTTAHCQKWKRVDPVNSPEVFQAVSETWGVVAVHDGKLINAFFFEHCDGRTRNSEEMLMPALGYLRSVDCSCGFLNLKGHGVGMCKRGAIVMARRGASFEQILRHYYRGISIRHAVLETPAAPEREEVKPPHAPERLKPTQGVIPRLRTRVRKAKEPVQETKQPIVEPEKPTAPTEPRETIPVVPPTPEPPPIEPELAKPNGEPAVQSEMTPVDFVPPQVEAAETIKRVDAEPPVAETTNAIPMVEPAIEPAPVAAKPIVEQPPVEMPTQSSVSVERPAIAERPAPPSLNEATLLSPDQVTVKPKRSVHVDYLPGERMICGCLPRAGIVVSIQDSRGGRTLVFSGNAPHYGEGGFESMVDADGDYVVAIEEQVIEVKVMGETVFIHVT